MKSLQKITVVLLMLAAFIKLSAQNSKLVAEAEQAMLKATQYMVENVSTNGGYVWYYLPDFSRRWGEMEAYKTMIWLQHPGTISMGHLFLDAYRATGNEYYYQSAEKAANAIIWGQSHEGGWNYMIDFAGDRSLKEWYNTIGKNGWRLEEFQHYYGNSTFDDDITSDAARFLLRMYLEKLDPGYKPALDKAIGFILKSQYPNGGWPQRYPLKNDFSKNGNPDYTSFYTFNDDVIWENVHFLIQCYLALGEERFLDPIHRGMDFYLLSQDSCGAWAQQLNLKMEAAGARTYEPAALLPSTTCENAFLLLKFYQYTGDRKFLVRVPQSIQWLEKTRLPASEVESDRTHPTFVEPGTNEPIYVHRKGSNVKFGRYFPDHSDHDLLMHYYGKCRVSLDELKKEYHRISSLSVEEVTKDSPVKVGKFEGEGSPQSYYDLNRYNFPLKVDEKTAGEIIRSLDSQNRWMSKHAFISHPYIGDGKKQEQTNEFASTNVGDETDTSPYRDPSDQLYISTGEYIRNMKMLINFVREAKAPGELQKSVLWH
ncbi:MAG: hypothetical protein JNK09_17890 [Prolixibacteraceae bacterium]|nr:hypothetical protein [Prolixibacteraceae bacterium]